MKSIGELTGKVLHSDLRTCTPTSKPRLDDRLIARLFLRMAAEYGYLWTLQCPDQGATDRAMQIWGERLADLTPYEIRTGIDNLPEKPPSAPQFRALCVADRPLSAAHRRFKALPRPKGDPDIAEAAFEAMRQCKQLTDDEMAGLLNELARMRR